MQPQEIIFRDDDIGYAHTAHAGEITMTHKKIFEDFVKVDQLFKKYNVKHTIAVIAKDIDKALQLVHYIKSNPHIDVQLHCWEHLRYAENLSLFSHHLEKAKGKLGLVFGKKPTVFYPPYNNVCPEMETICKEHGLVLSYEKCSLSGYLRGHQQKVINFHYWSDECRDLEAALKKYTGK